MKTEKPTPDPVLVAQGRKIRDGLRKAKCRWCKAPGITKLCGCQIRFELTKRNWRPFLPRAALHGPMGTLP